MTTMNLRLMPSRQSLKTRVAFIRTGTLLLGWATSLIAVFVWEYRDQTHHGLVPFASPTFTSPLAASSAERWKYPLREAVSAPFAVIVEKSAQ